MIDPNFVPLLDAEVEELTPGPDGTSVFVGGDFSTVNGATYKKIVRLRLSDGSIVTSFKANANALVQDVLLRNGWLYVSGKFTSIKSIARSGLARLDPITGNVDPNLDLPFTNPLNGLAGCPGDRCHSGWHEARGDRELQPGGRAVAQSRSRCSTSRPPPQPSLRGRRALFPVFDASGTTTWCSSSFSTYMRDIDIAPDGSYFVVVHDRCLPRQSPLRPDQPVRADDHRSEPGADLDRLDRRRHLVERQRERYGGLRRWTHAVDEQPVPRRHRGSGRGPPGGHRSAVDP